MIRIRNAPFVAAAVGLVAALVTPSAHAQYRYREYRIVRPHAAAADAFELQVGTGYTQGFGSASPWMTLPSIAGPGIAVDLDASYRATPYWSVGIQGEYAQYRAEQDEGARGATVNLGLTYHFAPFRRGDPWLRLGTGWRWLWSINPSTQAASQPTATLSGWQALKANIGYDIRLSEGFAIAPHVGADLTVFSWLNQAGWTSTMSTSEVGVFVNAGLQGRFDIGPAAVPATFVGRER